MLRCVNGDVMSERDSKDEVKASGLGSENRDHETDLLKCDRDGRFGWS